MSPPRFAAVIPAYNAEATLESAVGSVLRQSSPDLELVIVDDGSTDRTPTLARRLARGDGRVRVVSQENRGLAAARNAGIAASGAPYIGFLDSDDLWMPTYLEQMGGALDADPGAGFAYTDGWVLDDRSRRIRRTTVMERQDPPPQPPSTAEAMLRALVIRNFIPAETTVRREALEGVGNFDEALHAVEDYDLWLRMLAAGWRAVRPPGLLLVRREVASSMSKDPGRMYAASRDVLSSVADGEGFPADVRAVAEMRVTGMDRSLEMLDGRYPLRRAAAAARATAGRWRRRLLARRLWYGEPPAEVSAAFPDLERV